MFIFGSLIFFICTGTWFKYRLMIFLQTVTFIFYFYLGNCRRWDKNIVTIYFWIAPWKLRFYYNMVRIWPFVQLYKARGLSDNAGILLGASEVSANLYCNSRTSVLGRLRDYLRLLMWRTLLRLLWSITIKIFCMQIFSQKMPF